MSLATVGLHNVTTITAGSRDFPSSMTPFTTLELKVTNPKGSGIEVCLYLHDEMRPLARELAAAMNEVLARHAAPAQVEEAA